jgi:hypothetical protein
MLFSFWPAGGSLALIGFAMLIAVATLPAGIVKRAR